MHTESERLEPGPGLWLDQPVNILTGIFYDRFGAPLVVVEDADGPHVVDSAEVR
jgi:hypothetical protein